VDTHEEIPHHASNETAHSSNNRDNLPCRFRSVSRSEHRFFVGPPASLRSFSTEAPHNSRQRMSARNIHASPITIHQRAAWHTDHARAIIREELLSSFFRTDGRKSSHRLRSALWVAKKSPRLFERLSYYAVSRSNSRTICRITFVSPPGKKPVQPQRNVW